MKNKKILFIIFLLLLGASVFSTPLYSPTWGFRLDLPEDYTFSGGDGKDRFSFGNPNGAQFDLIIYHSAPGKDAQYATLEALAQDVQARLNNKGDVVSFEYRHKKAYIFKLSFVIPAQGGRTSAMSGWAFCLELGSPGVESENKPPRPMLLAMAYGPADRNDLEALHFSALDSVSPEEGDKWAPGLITEFSYPRETRIKTSIHGLGIEAQIYREDAEAAQALVDREFQILSRYANSPKWKEAWIRYYRAIYRDSFERLTDIAFQVERKLNVPERENRNFADQALQWVQTFTYERNLSGSDFINLISAATEGRGDCDPRAMLWAIILNQANIPSAMMVSREYSHAMGLADIPGAGARFELEGQKLLVAETTAKVSIGLIGENVSATENWLGIPFE